jgi:WD40 repeat protein
MLLPYSYHLATAGADGVKLWDLRKLRNFRTLSFDEGHIINSVTFDYSGQYLAVAGSSVRCVFGVTLVSTTASNALFPYLGLCNYPIAKSVAYRCCNVLLPPLCSVFDTKAEWSVLTDLKGHTKLVTDVKFGPNASFIVSSSLDRSVKVSASKDAMDES